MTFEPALFEARPFLSRPWSRTFATNLWNRNIQDETSACRGALVISLHFNLDCSTAPFGYVLTSLQSGS